MAKQVLRYMERVIYTFRIRTIVWAIEIININFMPNYTQFNEQKSHQRAQCYLQS